MTAGLGSSGILGFLSSAALNHGRDYEIAPLWYMIIGSCVVISGLGAANSITESQSMFSQFPQSLKPMFKFLLCLGLQLGIALTAFVPDLFVICPAESKESEEKKYEILVVLVYTDTCKVACTKVRPIMQELIQKYGERIKYIELNASTMDEAIKIAKSYKVETFLEDSELVPRPAVGFYSAKGKRLKELLGYKDKEIYQAVIDQYLVK